MLVLLDGDLLRRKEKVYPQYNLRIVEVLCENLWKQYSRQCYLIKAVHVG